MIYTSYFAKLKKIPDTIIPIGICAKLPKWYKGYNYKKVAPTYNILMTWKQNHDNGKYIKDYTEQILNKTTPEKVINDLYNLLPESCYQKDICLICYEKPTDFCHRHLIANWLNENGIKCEEWSE